MSPNYGLLSIQLPPHERADSIESDATCGQNVKKPRDREPHPAALRLRAMDEHASIDLLRVSDGHGPEFQEIDLRELRITFTERPCLPVKRARPAPCNEKGKGRLVGRCRLFRHSGCGHSSLTAFLDREEDQ